MKELSLRDIQLIELNILNYLDSKCKKLNLRYGLTSGSVLGAIRHKGFIPWDDDIDVVMPRPDYELLISEMQSDDSRYVLKTPYNDEEYLYEYIKLMDTDTLLIEDPDRDAIKTHIYIDIFPIDGVPSDPENRRKHFCRVNNAKKMFTARCRLKYKINRTKGLSRYLYKITNVIMCILPKSYYIQRLDRISKGYPFDTSEFAAVVTGQGEREVLRTKDYQLDGLVEFEGQQYSTYKKPEEYLMQFFGNYMELPPEEKRKGHNNKAMLL